MHAEERLIHFSTELIHPPMQHAKPQLQRLYIELAEARLNYDSSDLTPPGPPKFYSRRGKSQSIVVFLPDRVALIEEWADIPLVEFLGKVKVVASRAMELLGIGVFAAQTATLRATFALTHYSDARVFLLERVCGQAGRIGPHFGRPISVGGLRFVMPEVPGHRGDLNVAIESFRHSNHEILVELKGIYTNAAITRQNTERATAPLEELREFISRNVYPYLNQYDLPAEDV